ncbi:MAG: hypothetical protein CL607_13040 [Anaerolineaceae bacterium]|nr:hypothetical protein [Anaerolineaceae bacterium]
MNTAKTLYQLQSVELELIANKRRLRAIEASLEDNQAVQEAKQALEQAEAAFKPVKAHYNDVEHQIQSNQEKLTQTETRLYSGSVTNPKELQDMQQEVESLRKWRTEWDERLLVAMGSMENAQENLDLQQAQYDEALEAAAAGNAELLTEREQINAQNPLLEERRQEIAATIDRETLNTYVSLRRSKGNRAVSIIENDTCTVCGVSQIATVAKAVRAGDELVYCSNCGRILVNMGH